MFYLPEAHTDFLFAVLAEELGLVGVMTVIGLYALLIWRTFVIAAAAQRAEQCFSAFLAYGIGLWIGLQAFVNMGVNMGVLPTKGLTLPLMSFGGSSIVVMCVAVGLLLRIDQESRVASSEYRVTAAAPRHRSQGEGMTLPLATRNSSLILIMAGGTGGHVYPALAVAEQLRDWGVDVVWLGTRTGLEARVVPAAGFALDAVKVSGLRGKAVLQRVLAPFMLLWAFLQSLLIMLRRRPGAVLGMGGYVSGAGGVSAWLLRSPLLIHEQNAVAGLTNRVLARFATRVFEAFPNTFPAATSCAAHR